jgi:hypothetical protein
MIKLESTFINLKKELVLHRLHSNSNFNTKKWDLNSLTKKYN